MIINDRIKNILPLKDLNNIYIVTDFDRTISAGSSPTSWSVLEKNPLIPKEYINKAKELYKIYRPIEIDETLDFDYRSKMVKEWNYKHIELFIKYNLDESLFDDTEAIKFRKYTKEFLKYLYENKIPIIIISAGIHNFIESFLKNNNCFFDNIYICSNQILFKNGKASGLNDNIIHSLNKNSVSFNKKIHEAIRDRNQIVLFGDQINDIKMVKEEKLKDTIKIGFLTEETKDQIDLYKSIFDIVCSIDEGFDDIKQKIFEK